MPSEMNFPDDLRRSNGKHGGKDRRKKSEGRFPDDEDGNSPRQNAGPGQQKARRGSKNYRDLLDSDDDE